MTWLEVLIVYNIKIKILLFCKCNAKLNVGLSKFLYLFVRTRDLNVNAIELLKETKINKKKMLTREFNKV